MFRYSLELKRGPRRRGGVKLIKSRSSDVPRVRKRNHASRLQLRFWQGYLRLHVDHERGRVRRPDPRAECRRRGASPSVTKTKCPSDRGERDVSMSRYSKFRNPNRSRTGPPLTTQLQLKHVSAVSTANSKHHINHHRPAAGTGATLRRAAYERRDAPVHLARDRISRAPCLGAPSCARHRPRRSSARRP